MVSVLIFSETVEIYSWPFTILQIALCFTLLFNARRFEDFTVAVAVALVLKAFTQSTYQTEVTVKLSSTGASASTCTVLFEIEPGHHHSRVRIGLQVDSVVSTLVNNLYSQKLLEISRTI